MSRQLVWLRSDLRIHDNTALAAAAAKGPVVAVFLRSTAQWQAHGHGANKIDFWMRGVSAVKEALEGLNIPLLHRDIETFDKAPDTLLEIAREQDIDQLHFNIEYPLNEQRRDQAVRETFQQAGIKAHGHHDAVAFAPGSLLTGKGDYYGVFTPFAKAWHKHITPEQLALRDTPAVQSPLGIDSDPLPRYPPSKTPRLMAASGLPVNTPPATIWNVFYASADATITISATFPRFAAPASYRLTWRWACYRHASAFRRS